MKGKAWQLLGVYLSKQRVGFILYPPPGTEESYKIQAELGVKVDPANLENPTGKTGVAVGLLRCRDGAEIKVIDVTSNGERVPFQYYVGRRMPVYRRGRGDV